MGYIIFFAIVGGWISSWTGVFIGMAIGFACYRTDEAFRRIERLTASVAALQERRAAKQDNVEEKQPEQAALQPEPLPDRPAPMPPAAAPEFQTAARLQHYEPEDFFANLVKQLRKTSTVVQTGIVVLLFGVVFLVRYAAKNQQFTVETALMAAMGVGIVLLFIGWRLVERKRAYALMLQGGSVAVLFTCLFLSTEVYALFPVVVAFAAMICLSVLAGLLAVRYDARETALIGMGGGFAAPLLSPVTSDQLIFLFSYYFLLVIGVFVVSRLRNWRVLHLLSCLFIIFVGLFIGQSEEVSHVRWQLEPFLLLFFLFYTLTEFLTASKQKEAWGTEGMDFVLILAPPAACMFFQAVLSYPDSVHVFLITLALLTIYYGLAASWLQLQQAAAERLALLIRMCIGLAFFSGNLLILCAAGSVVSILLYNAEAVICIWLAARKRQELPLWFGMTLLLLSILMLPFSDWPQLVRSQLLLAASAGLSFCLSPFLCAVLLAKLPSADKTLAKGLLLWSLALWLLGGAGAIMKAAPADASAGLILLFISLSFGLLRVGSQRLPWQFMDQLCDGFGILLSLIAVNQAHAAAFIPDTLAPLAVLSSSAGWLVSLATYYGLLFVREAGIAPSPLAWQHRLGSWLAGGISILQICTAVEALFQPKATWLYSAFGLAAGGWVMLLVHGRKLRWPVQKHQLEYLGYGIIPFAAAAWSWTLNACLSLGDPSPLKYVPLLNPIETAQGICLAALFLWARELKRPALQSLPLPTVVVKNMGIALYGTLFLCLTMMITRSVCYYTHISFSAVGILSSPFLQTIISVLWSGTAFIIMLFSARAKRERENSLGTLLLFLVAAKLFLVDIHLSTELERICSFMWVGGIMLLAGYYMPTQEATGQ